MAGKKYTREFRLQVAREAVKPEYQGLEYVIAEKYGVQPWTIKRWKEHYQEHGEQAFHRGFTKPDKKTAREIELEKENDKLKEEVEILKKAAAFLANVKRE